MATINNIIQSLHPILSFAPAYKLLMKSLGGHSARLTHVQKHIRPQPGFKILDIGCGPGDILEYLPGVEYLGVDLDADYIAHAQSKYGNKGRFLCRNAAEIDAAEFETYDIVLATGLLHHLNDNEAIQLLQFASKALKPGGRLITYDGCYLEEKQHPFDRWMLDSDRGKFVRTKKQYMALANSVFPAIKPHLRSDLLRIPYTLLILECSNQPQLEVNS
jgi:SAM-dependent methyltransferase